MLDPLYNLNVLRINPKNCEVVDIRQQELFPRGLYDSLRIVIYSASRSKFAELIDRYDRGEILLGADEEDVLDQFEMHIDPRRRIHFWNSLSPVGRKKIQQGQWSVRCITRGHIVHSKIYILEKCGDPKPDGCRVIVGSPNCSKRALEDGQPEDAHLTDNHEGVYDHYDTRYRQLRKLTVPFLPKALLRRGTGAIGAEEEKALSAEIVAEWLAADRGQLAKILHLRKRLRDRLKRIRRALAVADALEMALNPTPDEGTREAPASRVAEALLANGRKTTRIKRGGVFLRHCPDCGWPNRQTPSRQSRP